VDLHSLPPASLLVSVLFIVIPVAMFAGMIGAIQIGRRIGARRRALADNGGGGSGEGTGAVEAGLFGLLGLLVAFSFSGAQARLDVRHAQIVQEANAIGTAYLRLDLLPDPARAALQERFRAYLDARIGYYRELLDFRAAAAFDARARAVQQEIWDRAIEATARASDLRAPLLIVPALNEMIDATSAREASLRIHPARTIYVLIGVLSLVCGLLAGVDLAPNTKHGTLYAVTFAVAMALMAYLILSIEFPRLGFVRFEKLGDLLVQVRADMH